MKLYVRTPSNGIVTTDVSASDTILAVKENLSNLIQVPSEHQKLILIGNTELENNKTLHDYHILSDGRTISLLIVTMKLYISLGRRYRNIEISTNSQETIGTIKERLASESPQTSGCSLSLNTGPQLQDDATIASLGIEDGTILKCEGVYIGHSRMGMISSFRKPESYYEEEEDDGDDDDGDDEDDGENDGEDDGEDGSEDDGEDCSENGSKKRDEVDKFDGYLLGQNPPPSIQEFCENWDISENSTDTYKYDKTRRNLLSTTQRKLCIQFLNVLWSIIADSYERQHEEPLYDMKVRFEQPAIAAMLLDLRSIGIDDHDHNSNALEELLAMHSGGVDDACIAFRYTRGPVPWPITWHFDGQYASETIQVALNDSSEYEGGRLCFFTPQHGVEALERESGDITIHRPFILHAVTRVIKGNRYSLFVVNKFNGLGDDLVINPTATDMRHIVDIMSNRGTPVYREGIVDSDVSIGSRLGTGEDAKYYEAVWKNDNDKAVCAVEVKIDSVILPDRDVIQLMNDHIHLLGYYGRYQCECPTQGQSGSDTKGENYSNKGKNYLLVEKAPWGTLYDKLLTMDSTTTPTGTINPLLALEIGLQICQGLAYLHTKLGLIQQHVTTKNILVFAFSEYDYRDVLVKVDGLALCHHRVGLDKLPIRWSAPEVLKKCKPSVESDVWSFGVLLWEIFSLANVPYFEFPSDDHVMTAITSGAKLACPTGCPESVYQNIILPCWEMHASDRPSFERLEQLLRIAMKELLDEKKYAAKKTCCFCNAKKPADVVLVKCGHVCACKQCMAEFKCQSIVTCPICKCKVDSYFDVDTLIESWE